MSKQESGKKGGGLPPIVTVTIQAAVMSATSNILAQAITAYRTNTSLVIDWVPVFQFTLFSIINTPPNFLWQDFLESTFPAYHVAPTDKAVASAASGDEKDLDKKAKEGKLVEPKLNITNTLIKTVLDQTVGALVNTLLFSLFMNSIQGAMAGRPAEYAGPARSAAYLVSGKAVDYGKVNWDAVVAKSRTELFPIMSAGLRLWPLVSLVNFAFVKTVQTRNLIGSLAGMAWGIYMSLFAAGH